MAFIQKNFTTIGGQSHRGHSPQIFSYRTADAHATVDGSGYFNAMFTVLELGDIIWVTVVDDVAEPTSVTTYGHHVVLSKAAGVVDISNVTIGVMTDTD